MSIKNSLLNAIRDNIKSGLSSLLISGVPVTVAENYYPDAINNLVGTNNFPAVILKDSGTISTERLSCQEYVVNAEIEAFLYVNADGVNDQTINANILEDAIIDIMQDKVMYDYEAILFYESTDKGFRQEGQEDYYTAGYYDTFNLSILRFSLQYRRC